MEIRNSEILMNKIILFIKLFIIINISRRLVFSSDKISRLSITMYLKKISLYPQIASVAIFGRIGNQSSG